MLWITSNKKYNNTVPLEVTCPVCLIKILPKAGLNKQVKAVLSCCNRSIHSSLCKLAFSSSKGWASKYFFFTLRPAYEVLTNCIYYICSF